MADITVNQLNKFYGSNHVLKGISFEIHEGEKVGLLGKNGSGKTTLFKIITGRESSDSGTVNVVKSRNIAVLDQIPDYPQDCSVQAVLNTAFDKIIRLGEQMRELEQLMQENHGEELLKRYGVLQADFEASGGYNMDSSIDKVCSGLDIDVSMRSKPFNILSGGEKTRVNLARILLDSPDILLLDEPTNHLDLKAIEWLEEFLVQYRGTILVISHDRFFLDKTISRIIELEDGVGEFYAGNYSYYIKEKEDRFLRQLEQYEQQQKKINQLEKAAKKLHEWANNADNPALHKRAFAIEKRIERMDKADKPREDKGLKGEFSHSGFSGKDVVLLQNVTKAFGDKTLVSDLSLSVLKDDRVAILGDNGCGKSTLLKLITGEFSPDSGSIKAGSSIKPAYLEQLVTFDNPDFTVLDTVRYAMETNEEKARKVLAAFQFTGKDTIKKVSTLSGGEKSRLRLCLLMQTDCNLLLLDEPTNHLDISSREWIEKAVDGFKGTVLFVSHDRYFINRFATRVWEMRDGGVTDFKGSYKEYTDWKQREKQVEVAVKPLKGKTEIRESCKKEKAGVSEYTKASIEGKIAELEKSIKEIDIRINDSESDYVYLQELLEHKNLITLELDALYVKWMEP